MSLLVVLQGLIRAVSRIYGSSIDKFNFLEPSRPKAVEQLFSSKSGTRTIYCSLLEYYYPRPSDLTNAEIKWNRDINADINRSQLYWKHRSCTNNKKIIWFQDRILHRILTTNQLVSEFSDTDPKCSFCKGTEETLLHLFCHCEVIAGLWSAVECSASRSGLLLTLNEYSIILGNGITDASVSDEKAKMVSLIILLFKFYIYRTKVASGVVTSSLACAYIKAMIAADTPTIELATTEKEASVIETCRWAVEMLNQWMEWVCN